jgi:hypothetical protein
MSLIDRLINSITIFIYDVSAYVMSYFDKEN